jgi:hypothetical protein
MYYKEHKTALCSSTKSGKVIDNIISRLGIDIEVLKTNLCFTTHMPNEKEIFISRQSWIDMNEPAKEDVVVLLGAFVHNNFPTDKIDSRIVKIAHPSSTNYRSKAATEEYITNAVSKILTAT